MNEDKVLVYLLIAGAVILIISIVYSDIRFKKSMDLLDKKVRGDKSVNIKKRISPEKA